MISLSTLQGVCMSTVCKFLDYYFPVSGIYHVPVKNPLSVNANETHIDDKEKSLMKIARFFQGTNLNGGGVLTMISSGLRESRGRTKRLEIAPILSYILAYLSLKRLDPNPKMIWFRTVQRSCFNSFPVATLVAISSLSCCYFNKVSLTGI